jgi:hypothetical protein
MSGLRTSSIDGASSPSRFLIFSLETSRGPEVRDGRGHHDGLDRITPRGDGRLHVERGAHPHDHHAGRIGERDGARDERDLGAAVARTRCDRPAHAARAAVAEETNGIERLEGRPRGDEQAHALEVPSRTRREEILERVHDRERLAHAPEALFSARELAEDRADQAHAPAREHACVLARGRVLPHAVVHRGRDEHRAIEAQRGRAHGILGEAVREARHHVRGRRRDDERVGPAREIDVDFTGVAGIPEVGHWRCAGEPGERQGSDELAGGVRHRHAHRRASRAISSRAISAALYAAMPPVTPRTMCLPPRDASCSDMRLAA